MAYTPLKPGQEASFGTSGQAVTDLQTKLNTQNQGKAGWVPLKVDAMYGPKTQAAVNFNPTITPVNPLITTGATSAMEFGQNAQQLNQMLGSINPGATSTNQNKPADMLETYSDPYTQALDKLAANSDKATQNLVATIKAKKSSRENTINSEYDRLKAGLMSLGVSTEKMKFTPELVYGGIMQAENQKAAKLQELDQEEATALLDAQIARDNKDFTLLKDRIAYLKDIKNQKLDVLKNTYDTLNYENKIGEAAAIQAYDQIQKLSGDKKSKFLQELAIQSGIPLMALTAQINEIARDRAKETKKSATTKSSSSAKYTWGNPTAATKTKVEQYLQKNSQSFADDLKKAQTDQEFFLFLLNKASEKASKDNTS